MQICAPDFRRWIRNTLLLCWSCGPLMLLHYSSTDASSLVAERCSSLWYIVFEAVIFTLLIQLNRQQQHWLTLITRALLHTFVPVNRTLSFTQFPCPSTLQYLLHLDEFINCGKFPLIAYTLSVNHQTLVSPSSSFYFISLVTVLRSCLLTRVSCQHFCTFEHRPAIIDSFLLSTGSFWNSRSARDSWSV